MVISVLKFFRLADKVKLPKEAQMERMRFQPTQA
jgi:stearoyl-CoA desaturase (delta-9 desaturase)